MKIQTDPQLSNATTTNFMRGRSLLLQRQCACGSSAGTSGECAACANKQRLQANLSIGASNDLMEREAERVARQVLAGPAHPTLGKAPHIKCYTRQATGFPATAQASVEHVLASAGRPLDAAVQQDMGQRFGHDFSRVRVHTGTAAEQSARDVNADAYTTGSNIVFNAGQFAPGSSTGRRLLAHELTHVVQQTGPAANQAGQGVAQRGLPLAGKNRVVQKQEAQTTTENAQEKTERSKLSLQLTEPNFLSLRKPFFDRNAAQLWDPDSALSVWKFNVDFFKGFGITENWARKAANLTAPFAIDAQLKIETPT